MRALLYLLAGLAAFAVLAPVASVRAAGPPPHDQSAKAGGEGQGQDKELTPEQKFKKRFPHPARVGHLIGLPVLDDDDSTIGYVREVVRAPDGKISLIVPYSAWFGWLRADWGKRPVAVPIETVTLLSRQFDSVDMSRDEYKDAPTWSSSQAQTLPPDEKILVALGRR
jgi:PRC-barrel domain